MEKINNNVVAIIDSGINYKDPFFKPHIEGGISFIDEDKNHYIDENGHGSLCASTIIKENPKVKLYIEKILNKDNLSTLDILEESLVHLIDKKEISIISMSLTLTSLSEEQRLKSICEKLHRQNKLIICTLANGAMRSYPASYNSTIGVQGFILEDENTFWFDKSREIQAMVDTNPYLLRDNCQQYRLFGKSNSYSAAKFAGMLSKIIDERNIKDINEIENILETMARRKEWGNDDLKASKRFPEFIPSIEYDKDIVQKIAQIVKKYLKIEDISYIYEHNLFDSHVGMNYKNAFGLLQKIEQEFKIHIKNYSNLSRYDFYSIYTLATLIKKGKYT